jgi:hypothetical protein
MDWHPLTHWLCGNRLSRRIADAAFVGYSRRRMAELDVLRVDRVQEHTLLELVRRAQQTRFGREHDFSRIRSRQDYQRLVPLRDYEQFWTTYWKSSYPRLAGTTWPDPIPYFALSSGTTSGTTKYLPISWDMVRSNSKAAATLLAGFVNMEPRSHLLWGQLFLLGGSTDLQRVGTIERAEGLGSSSPGTRLLRLRSLTRQRSQSRTQTLERATTGEILAGDLSGIAAREVPEVLRPYSFPPTELALLSDWDEKVRVLAEESVSLPITLISGIPSWLLILFARLKEVTGKDRIADIWPGLRLVVHGGIKFDPYRETLRREIGSPQVRFLESYPCSEGFVAFEDPRHDLLRLVPDHGIFFEFVPLEELGKDRPTRHTAAEVEVGVQYAVVLTTCAGLWSYLVGDTVAFEQRDPPLLRFTGRTKYFLSAFGEHVIDEEVEKAVAQAAAACQAAVADFHVGPLFPGQPPELGRHLYLIEFTQAAADLSSFAGELDRQLCRLNDDYAAHRKGGIGMAPPEVRPVAPGGFAAWLRSQGKLGGQHKVPRMDNSATVTRQMAEWMAREGYVGPRNDKS